MTPDTQLGSKLKALVKARNRLADLVEAVVKAGRKKMEQEGASDMAGLERWRYGFQRRDAKYEEAFKECAGCKLPWKTAPPIRVTVRAIPEYAEDLIPGAEKREVVVDINEFDDLKDAISHACRSVIVTSEDFEFHVDITVEPDRRAFNRAVKEALDRAGVKATGHSPRVRALFLAREIRGKGQGTALKQKWDKRKGFYPAQKWRGEEHSQAYLYDAAELLEAARRRRDITEKEYFKTRDRIERGEIKSEL